MLTQDQHEIITQFQSEVESVLPLSIAIKGKEALQRQAGTIIRQLTQDLINGYDTVLALKIAVDEIRLVLGSVC